MFSKKGQVWVETVIYTLIAFIMIGLVLSFARPKIEESKDKAILEQSLSIVKNIDTLITDVKDSPGNKRQLELQIREGKLMINSTGNLIYFQMKSKYPYSEAGLTIQEGNINITTIETGESDTIIMERKFSGLNLTWQNKNIEKTLTQSPQPYKLFISNEGENGGTKINFDLE